MTVHSEIYGGDFYVLTWADEEYFPGEGYEDPETGE